MRGTAPGQQQLDDVQVVVVHGHVQGGQAVLWGDGDSLHSGDNPMARPQEPGLGVRVTLLLRKSAKSHVRARPLENTDSGTWATSSVLGATPQSWGSPPSPEGHPLTPEGHCLSPGGSPSHPWGGSPPQSWRSPSHSWEVTSSVLGGHLLRPGGLLLSPGGSPS